MGAVVDGGGVLAVPTGSAAEVEVAPGTSYTTPLGALDDTAATRSPLVTSTRGCPKACFAKKRSAQRSQSTQMAIQVSRTDLRPRKAVAV